jgi:hypothetical protein
MLWKQFVQGCCRSATDMLSTNYSVTPTIVTKKESPSSSPKYAFLSVHAILITSPFCTDLVLPVGVLALARFGAFEKPLVLN